MAAAEPLTTYLELRVSAPDGSEGSGLTHQSAGLFLLHVLEVAAYGEPIGGVTIVHDAGDHGARYLAAARVLAEQHWAVALPDLRGHGRSEGPRGHSLGAREVLRDLQSVQDHLAYRLPDAPKVLIGQGLGALHALHFALEKPDALAALVLLSPRWKPGFELPKPASGLKKLFSKPAPTDEGRIGNRSAALSGLSAERQAWEGDALVHDVITRRAAEAALGLAQDCRRRASELRVPTLLLHGESDQIADPADSRTFAAPVVELRLLPGKAHDLLHESGAEQLAIEIAAWLASVIARARN
ncbi:MAG: alpha/beta fold hydrolase [Planctomycetota bacterium]